MTYKDAQGERVPSLFHPVSHRSTQPDQLHYFQTIRQTAAQTDPSSHILLYFIHLHRHRTNTHSFLHHKQSLLAAFFQFGLQNGGIKLKSHRLILQESNLSMKI